MLRLLYLRSFLFYTVAFRCSRERDRNLGYIYTIIILKGVFLCDKIIKSFVREGKGPVYSLSNISIKQWSISLCLPIFSLLYCDFQMFQRRREKCWVYLYFVILREFYFSFLFLLYAWDKAIQSILREGKIADLLFIQHIHKTVLFFYIFISFLWYIVSFWCSREREILDMFSQ